MFASHSRARVMNTRMALTATKKGNLKVAEYVAKMRGLADDMASAGKKLDDDDIVSDILAGLDDDFDPVVSAVAQRSEPISVGELFSQLVTFEQRLELRQGGIQSSTNSASRGGNGGGRGHGQPNQGQNLNRGRGGQGRGRGGFTNNQGGDHPKCQLCDKLGHTVVKCYKRFDASFTGEEKSAAAATSSYGVGTNWYIDTGATDHITSDLDKLTVREKYNGGDQVHTASGSGMKINQIGQSIVRTQHRDLILKNILYVPEANKSLISAHRLAFDNQAFLELFPRYFSIKDQVTRKLLHQGRCERGLYPLKSFPNKQVFAAIKLSPSQWHCRLGHPSSVIVQQVLSHNNLPCVSESNKHSVCDACQKGKSHQLPYSKSLSRSSAPLELIHSDVWGPAPTSVGKNNYYVSFVDDFSKFSWIYLLKHKSDVFQCFHNFQNPVERLFDRKILAMQTDWVVNITNSIPFFNASVFLTVCHVHMHINKTGLPNVSTIILLKLGYPF
ncbi:hypothetical protein OsJ_07890 [Oryza sativa Japonica Group]|nr:hypothetical protein OsJ_07890 [Oryza sativa Japonica Group]